MRRRAAIASVVAGLLALGLPAGADDVGPEAAVKPRPKTRQLAEPPLVGSYYDSWEPTFYTGFAPRALDPRRLHVHVGRGNQLRITLVLADDVIDSYARDRVRIDEHRDREGQREPLAPEASSG